MSDTAGSDKAPLAFKVLVGAAAMYLLVRLVQMGAWVLQRIG